jgi:photosystem II stability/assembly factor-like uncharacterized protein
MARWIALAALVSARLAGADVTAPGDGTLRWHELREGDENLYGVCDAGGVLVVVGMRGKVLRSIDRGRTWRPALRAPDFDLYDVACDGANAWAVGSEGQVVRSRDAGDTWAVDRPAVGGTLTDVAIGGGTAWAVGSAVPSGGEVIRRTGARWSRAFGGARGGPLYGVWTDGNQVYAVGQLGAIVRSRDDGHGWSPLTSSMSADLLGIWGDGKGRLVAVGRRGAIVRSDDQGDHWTAVDSGTREDLIAVWGDREIYVVGLSGSVLTSTSGVTWRKRPATGADKLYDVAGGPAGVFAVGSGGRILELQ